MFRVLKHSRPEFFVEVDLIHLQNDTAIARFEEQLDISRRGRNIVVRTSVGVHRLEAGRSRADVECEVHAVHSVVCNLV